MAIRLSRSVDGGIFVFSLSKCCSINPVDSSPDAKAGWFRIRFTKSTLVITPSTWYPLRALMSAFRAPSLVSPQLTHFGQQGVVINADHASCHNAAVHPNVFALWRGITGDHSGGRQKIAGRIFSADSGFNGRTIKGYIFLANGKHFSVSDFSKATP